MTGVNTNVLVRFLVGDDDAQADRVHRFLAQSRAAAETVYVSSLVLCETVWVLRSVFKKTRQDIVRAVEHLLDLDVFEIEDADAVRRALQSFRTEPGDFTDHLIGQLNRERGCRFTVTFDRGLRRASDFSML